MSFEEDIASLYGADPADFTAMRNALAKQYRKDGQKDLAEQVSALRKPTKVAWALNQVVVQSPIDVKRVSNNANRLREVQRALLESGPSDDFRDVQREFRESVITLQKRVASIAGDAAGVGVASRIEQAAWNPDALSQLLSGHLSSVDEVTSGSGFDLFAGVSVPDAKRKPSEDIELKRQQEERDRLDTAVQHAESAVEEAQRRLERAQQQLEKARQARADFP